MQVGRMPFTRFKGMESWTEIHQMLALDRVNGQAVTVTVTVPVTVCLACHSPERVASTGGTPGRATRPSPTTHSPFAGHHLHEATVHRADSGAGEVSAAAGANGGRLIHVCAGMGSGA